MEQSLLNVSGMSCSGCEQRIAKVLKQLDGVFKAEANYESGEVRIIFDISKTSEPSIRDAIAQAGYKVSQ